MTKLSQFVHFLLLLSGLLLFLVVVFIYRGEADMGQRVSYALIISSSYLVSAYIVTLTIFWFGQALKK